MGEEEEDMRGKRMWRGVGVGETMTGEEREWGGGGWEGVHEDTPPGSSTGWGGRSSWLKSGGCVGGRMSRKGCAGSRGGKGASRGSAGRAAGWVLMGGWEEWRGCGRGWEEWRGLLEVCGRGWEEWRGCGLLLKREGVKEEGGEETGGEEGSSSLCMAFSPSSREKLSRGEGMEVAKFERVKVAWDRGMPPPWRGWGSVGVCALP